LQGAGFSAGLKKEWGLEKGQSPYLGVQGRIFQIWHGWVDKGGEGALILNRRRH